MNYVVDKVKEEQKEDVSILTHPRNHRDTPMANHQHPTTNFQHPSMANHQHLTPITHHPPKLIIST